MFEILWDIAAFNTLWPRQNGRHFPDDIFKYIFLNENIWISIKISLKFVPKGPIDNILALFQMMAWRRIGAKPLFGPMLTRLTDAIFLFCFQATGQEMPRIITSCVRVINLYGELIFHAPFISLPPSVCPSVPPSIHPMDGWMMDDEWMMGGIYLRKHKYVNIVTLRWQGPEC